MTTRSLCSYFNEGLCRSCKRIEQPYPEQIKTKERGLRDALQLPSGFPLEHSTESFLWGFRNRAKMSVTGTLENPVIGLLGEADLDHGRELLSCPIQHPALNEIISGLPALIKRGSLVPYQIESRSGELKGLILFYSPISEEIYIRFVLRSKECVSRIKKLLPDLKTQFPRLACVSANIQPIPHAILEGPEEIFITEKTFIEHTFQSTSGLLSLTLAPQGFVQTNFEVATALYQTAANWIAEAKPANMLELFSGQGAFSFFAAKNAKKILGIEINTEAVNAANETARRLGLGHVEFRALNATQISDEANLYGSDLILVNPPRRGLGNSLALIQKCTPKNLIYSSCSAESLAADLRALDGSYRIQKIQLFDMFPHTEHFETLVWLAKV